MAQDVTLLKAELSRIERDLKTVQSKLNKLANGEQTKERPFSKLRGMAKGVDLSLEEIKSHEYTLADDSGE